jgi:hypothetical protein
MARAACRPGLLERGSEGRLVASIGRSLKGAKLGQHIPIGGFKTGAISPNGRQSARIA